MYFMMISDKKFDLLRIEYDSDYTSSTSSKLEKKTFLRRLLTLQNNKINV